MKFEYRLLNDIMAKPLTAKARPFDAFTTDRLEIMVAISKGMSINWSDNSLQDANGDDNRA